MVTLTRTHDGVFVIHLGEGDLRFTTDQLRQINEALDHVEDQAAAPAALVTAASGKIWHNGLDLEFMATLGRDFIDYIADVQRLLARFLTLPVPTVAAVQGHAFAGGAMLALTHDVRVMRSDRGYICLPEIDLGMPFSDGMAALLAAKLEQPALHRMTVLGERIDGETALALGLVDQLATDEATVLDASVEEASRLAPKAKPTIAALRRNFYGSAIDALTSLES